MSHYNFDDVNHALIWSTEHLRRKSFPKISDIYKSDSAVNVSDDKVVKAWSGSRDNLPSDAEEAMLLAMKVYRFVRALKPEEQQIILLRYWGDYHSQNYLKSALQIKEAMRLRGQHVRLNYRFSYKQIAQAQNLHYKKAERELKRILAELELKMSEKDLVPVPCKAEMSTHANGVERRSAWDVDSFCPQ